MSKVYSFDVFDTLVTRKVGLPDHIFLLAGNRIREELNLDIDPQIFANARIQAGRELSSSNESQRDIYKIYQYLAKALHIPDDIKDRMLQIELDTEFENIIPVKKNVNKLESLRERGDRIIYISDMYLGEEILKKLLAGLGIYKKGEHLFVSCDYGSSKTNGKLFDIVVKELGIQKQDLHHFGNGKKSDILGAEKAGITSTYLPDGNINRYERVLVLGNKRHNLNTNDILRYSQIAAATRHARLQRKDENKEIYDISCSVAAPMLYSFVSYVLENAKDKRIFFLARDGYIMYQIARRIKEYRKLDTDIKYLYISREVLVLAKYDQMDYDQYIDYIAEIFSEETLISIFRKLKVSDSVISRTSLTENELKRKLFFIGKEELHKIFSINEIHEDIESESRRKMNRLFKYFKSEGLLDDKKIAIADTGWKLTIQNLIVELFSQYNVPQPEGYYFGINEPAYSPLHRGGKHGFFWDLRKEESSLADPKIIRIFEVFCSAPHGQTVDYISGENSIEPEFSDRETRYLVDWGIEDMENGILRTVDSLLELHDKVEFITDDRWDRIIHRELVENFWYNPSQKAVKIWGKFPYIITHDGSSVSNLFEKKTFWSLFKYVLRRGKLPNSRLDHWPQAYVNSLKPVQRTVITNTIKFKKSAASFRRKYLPI